MHSAIAGSNVHTPPPISQYATLKASDLAGSLYLVFACGLTGLSLYLSSFSETSFWLIGQLLFATVFVQWFAILHEAGHKSLFRTPILNFAAGHLAGFLAGFPFDCWKLIHGLHHHWTGWQDLDATTAGLTPRERSKWILLAVRICWACWIPVFSVIYRLDNYWNVPRLQKLFARKCTLLQFALSVGGQILVYGLVVYLVGPWQLLRLIGLGILLGLMVEDLLILSQHTHVPMLVSHGEPVSPIPPLQQEVFTRSLRFPAWFSRLILLNLDAHELHHMYVQVPGYLLHRIEYVPQNEISWWQWLVKSKQVRGDVLLFQNRNQTGLEL